MKNNVWQQLYCANLNSHDHIERTSPEDERDILNKIELFE